MATATKKVGAATPVANDASRVRESASLEFLIHLTNSGEYQWEIVDGIGNSLARSGSMASYADAERAARYVYEGARSARFEPHEANGHLTAAV